MELATTGSGKKKGGEEGASRGVKRNGKIKGLRFGGGEGEQSRYKKGGGRGIACCVFSGGRGFVLIDRHCIW